MIITKLSGAKEDFSEEKLTLGLQNSGINPTIISFVLSQIRKKLYHGIPSRKIYQEVRNLLLTCSSESVARYKLKQAILELESSGYSFDNYIGVALRAIDYAAQVGVVVKGSCINHQIDVVAEQENHHYMIECEFYKQQGQKADVKVPMYVRSKFKDLEYSWRRRTGQRDKFHQAWIVTNARFTPEALTYGEHSGLKLISWDHPKNSGLKNLISSFGLYPITCLSSLTKAEKKQLLGKGIVLCRTICDNPDILSDIGFEYGKVKKIVQEGRQVCEFGVKVLSKS